MVMMTHHLMVIEMAVDETEAIVVMNEVGGGIVTDTEDPGEVTGTIGDPRQTSPRRKSNQRNQSNQNLLDSLWWVKVLTELR